jgi:hypothetical protein
MRDLFIINNRMTPPMAQTFGNGELEKDHFLITEHPTAAQNEIKKWLGEQDVLK